MAAPDAKAMFEIDAGKLLAKLHLAGQEQVPNSIVINTAVKDPDSKATPQNPGKVSFDTKTQSYQVAVVKKVTFKDVIDPTKGEKVIKAQKKIDDYKKKHGENHEKDSATDKTNEMDKQEKDKYYNELLDALDQYKVPGYTRDKDNPEESVKKFNEALEKENKKRTEDYKKAVEETKKAALEDLATYYKNFAGQDAEAKVKSNSNSIAVFDVNADGSLTDAKDFTTIKDGSIDVEALEKNIIAQKKAQKKKPNEDSIKDIAFVIGFDLDTEK